MVTSRRSRVIAIAAIIATIVFFLFSSDSRSSALATAQAATEKARGKAEKVNEQVLKPIAEDAKQLVGQEKPSKAVADKVVEVTKPDASKEKAKEVATVDDDAAKKTETYNPEADYKRYLSKSPFVIFSKSYCPFSKIAKDLLLVKYTITPEPVVVEIDLHPNGPELQKYIGEQTGRRTVPNIHIQNIARGGADDFTALENGGTLVSQIKEWFKANQDVTGFTSFTIKKNEATM